MTLHFKVSVEAAETISILLHLNFLQPLLDNRRAYQREELANILKAHHLILLKKPRCISLRLLLDEMREVTRLRIVDFSLRFNLPYCVERIKLSDDDSTFIVSLLNYTAEEVIICGGHPMVEDWGVIHVVFEHGKALVLLLIYLPEQI